MTTDVATVRPQTPVDEIARLMLERRISAVPVVDPEGYVEGIVSEGDLIRRVGSRTTGPRSWWLDLLAGREATVIDYMKSHGRVAGDVMTREVVTIGERTPLGKVATLLERHRIKRVPVVRNGRLVGIVSRANLLQGLIVARALGGAGTVADARIRKRIKDELERAGVRTSYVNVVVARGVVEVWGFVETAAQRRALGPAARSVNGVKRIVNNVVVTPPRLQAALGAQ